MTPANEDGLHSLAPGSVVVFEGLDRAGKSTQLDLLAGVKWRSPVPAFAHMPSGLTSLTSRIYALTEQERISSPLARQLLHLACHAENMPRLLRARDEGGLVLDRWWWSTMAYGWYANGPELGVDIETFQDMIGAVWSELPADVVFLFATPFEVDALNEESVLRGYRALAEADSEHVVTVPAMDPGGTADFILSELRARGLVQKNWASAPAG